MRDENTEKKTPGAPALQGGLVRYLADKARILRLTYKPLLFVWLSFFIMTATSYVIVNQIMREQLLESTNCVISSTQTVILSSLTERQMMLRGLSDSMRNMIERGRSAQVVDELMKSTAVYVVENTDRKAGVFGVFGSFDVFGGLFLTDGTWQPPADFVPQREPWYAAAVAANGEVAETVSYANPRKPGVLMTYSRRIFDSDAKPLAVVAVDVVLDEMLRHVVDTRLADGGYGVLLDVHLTVIAHKDASLIGKPFRDINSDAARTADDLRHGAVFERAVTDFRGNAAIASFRRLSNGWHLGMVTPVEEYYRGARGLRDFLLVMGALLATALSLVLLHLAAAREKADERMRIMLDAMPLCTNFWIREYQNIECDGGAISLAVAWKALAPAYKNIDCNAEAVRLFGVSSKREYNERFHELSPEKQPCGRRSDEKALALVRQAFEEGYSRFEWMHRKLDGELIPCEITLIRVVYQGDYTVLGYTRDLRELKAAQERIAAENAQRETLTYWYESVLNAIPVPVSVQDEDGKWTFVNAALADMIGQAWSDLLGMPCSMCQLSICNTDRCAMACARRGERQTSFVYAGSSYLVNVARLRDAQGTYVGFIETIHDVTQLEQLTRQKVEAESVSRAKSAFLAMVSHEIRTPMNAILGLTEMQMQNVTLPYEAMDAFGKIYTAGHTLLGIINDLLDLSRIDAGKMELAPVKYSVAGLLGDTAQMNMVYVGGRPISFTLYADKDLPSELFGDELRIKQILSNLLSNAFKYTDAGEVVLSVTVEYGTGEAPEATLVCRVSDTGQGMTPDQVSRLFDEYSRFSLEANRTIEGFGLGMSITRQLVHLMGGTISVESAPQRGSTFTVRLPQGLTGADSLGGEVAENLRQLNADMASHAKTAHLAREPMPYGSVLIVDDLNTNVYVTSGLLAPYGLSIDSAADGFEALDKIRSGKEYDIIFMDYRMPKMDGVETTKIMRDLGYSRPIVALTADVVAGQPEMFLENGFDDFLAKPVDLRRLNALLNRLIRDRQAPEVIAAARRQQAQPRDGDNAPMPAVDPYLANIFAQDAARVVATLEKIAANQFRTENDIQQFIVSIHSMKSALANVGELRLAAVARALEQAGCKRDIAVMSAETPLFLDALRAVIETIRSREEDEDSGAADVDLAYLREKLLAIQAACDVYDKRAAKEALAELRRKVWPRLTGEQLNTIAAHLLHSDFEEAAGVAERIAKDI